MRQRSRIRLEQLSRKEDYLRRAASAAPYTFLAITLGLSILLGVLHNRWRAAHRPDPVLAGVRTVVFPFQYVLAQAEGAFSSAWSSLFAGRRLQEENEQLRKEIARLKLESQALRTDVGEVARLRAALEFKQKTRRPLLAAEVIGLRPSPLFDTINIARGARDGVRVGMVVRTPDGLLGQVSDVAPLSSTVMLLTDASSGVGAMVVRRGKVQSVGIVEGRGRGQALEMVYMKQDDPIWPGDAIFSSGYGGVVPADIPIGKIVSVTEDRARFLKSARVAPAAALHRAREVLLLR